MGNRGQIQRNAVRSRKINNYSDDIKVKTICNKVNSKDKMINPA